MATRDILTIETDEFERCLSAFENCDEELADLLTDATIIAHGERVEIAVVLYAEADDIWDEDCEYDIEFVDSDGRYRHYQSWVDKGEIILNR